MRQPDATLSLILEIDKWNKVRLAGLYDNEQNNGENERLNKRWQGGVAPLGIHGERIGQEMKKIGD